MERSTIHLLHKRGASVREIARTLGHDRKTVARALVEPLDRAPAKRRRTSQVDPFREQIAQWLRDGLTAVRMLELARADPERPYPGKHAVFRAAVREERLRQQQTAAVQAVSVRFEGLPAEYLQVDWGEIRTFPFTSVTRTTPRALGAPTSRPTGPTRYFLACRLKYSRWMWVRFTTEMRQETLFRGLVDCFCALGFVPWVLVFDNMRTVTSGRDPQRQPVWTPALLQLAHEFGFHPEACTPGAANQKGSVESLVRFVKGNFLAGRTFVDDTDLETQCAAWLEAVNDRPSQATDVAPLVRLPDERAKGGMLPVTAHDYGFAHAARVTVESLVAVLGNQYSVPIVHTGAPVTVRVHRDRVVIWRDAVLLAEHPRALDGAHRRVVEPSHYALLFTKKPRAQVMLYREALLDLGEVAQHYVTEVSYRRRAHLRAEILGLHALYEHHGRDALLAAMVAAAAHGTYGVDALRGVLGAFGGSSAHAAHTMGAPPPAPTPAQAPPPLALRTGVPLGVPVVTRARDGVPGEGRDTRGTTGTTLHGLPSQDEVDRALVVYERHVLAVQALLVSSLDAAEPVESVQLVECAS